MKIEIKNSSSGDNIKLCQFPSDREYFGDGENNFDLKIFIKKKTLNDIDEYLSSDMNNELGGVIVGDIFVNEADKKFILIDNLIIAKHSNSSLSRLTFTHETWDYINDVLEKTFPEKKILGWFHSHPGHTVFLSNFDMFIQENFFNMDYMVAYVYDPTIKERGFFLWRNNKIVKADGYYVTGIRGDDEYKVMLSINQDKDLLEMKNAKKNNKGLFGSLQSIGLLILTLLIILIMIYNIYDLKQKSLLEEKYIKDLNEIRADNKRLEERLNDLATEMELKRNSAGNANENINSENQTTDNSILKYTVKRGDTLEKISNQFYNSDAGIELIMKKNGLKDKFDLRIGQEIELPQVSQ